METFQALCKHINQIAPDTFDEGEFGPWNFLKVTREGTSWRIKFDNAEGIDEVTFQQESPGLLANGNIDEPWMESLNHAVSIWEAKMRGEDGSEEADADDES